MIIFNSATKYLIVCGIKFLYNSINDFVELIPGGICQPKQRVLLGQLSLTMQICLFAAPIRYQLLKPIDTYRATKRKLSISLTFDTNRSFIVVGVPH